MECKKCKGTTDGFKCDACGEEFGSLPAEHECGVDRCLPKCTGCNEAESKCSC